MIIMSQETVSQKCHNSFVKEKPTRKIVLFLNLADVFNIYNLRRNKQITSHIAVKYS